MVLVGPIGGHGIGGSGSTDCFKRRSSSKGDNITYLISIVQKGEHALCKTWIKYFGFKESAFLLNFCAVCDTQIMYKFIKYKMDTGISLCNSEEFLTNFMSN